ncbi:MAG: hypothetical protein WEB89_08895 [Balneolales bacterium]
MQIREAWTLHGASISHHPPLHQPSVSLRKASTLSGIAPGNREYTKGLLATREACRSAYAIRAALSHCEKRTE